MTRREVLRRTGAVTAAAAVLSGLPAPAILAAAGAAAPLRAALIGCGGRGRSYLPELMRSGPGAAVRLVALADADEGSLTQTLRGMSDLAAKQAGADFDAARIKTFSDYRALFDKAAGEIDVVFIATPDHQHACPAMTAIKLGKHVYCEKPLVHHVAEARALAEAARAAKVATQMGNQGSGTGGHQTLAEYLAAGAIGALREVHAWHVFASRFGGSMPQPEPQPAPKGLNWDAWLGPAAERPFAAVYRPWHGWCDFGTGSLGGWATHSMDAVCFALKLAAPKSVELLDVGDASETRFPRWSTVRYDFPQRGELPPISVHWHEGSKPNSDPNFKNPDGKTAQTTPHRPSQAAEIERQLGKPFGTLGAGSVWVGEKGMIFCSSHGGSPQVFPEALRKEFTSPPKILPRPSGGIMGDFLRACRAGGGPTCSGFASFAGPFLEMLLVGHLAMRAGLNRPVQWDGAALKCLNHPELNQYVRREYRAGWTL
jgi:predicted dehydrogenase